jgi:3-dehydro-L-gulonate 2-dehydrogenase
MTRIPYEDMLARFRGILLKIGFREDRAALCARLFAESSRDGVYTHGLNRFPRFIEYVEKGIVRIHEEPSLVHATGPFERWDGRLGPGNLNAYFSMNRAIELAKATGMGCVALKDTNHWMRAGTYGWQAAEADCIGICWTNTMPNMPSWGSKESRLGNNPIVFAIPKAGGHIVFDSAMSMFSYGKLEAYSRGGKELPVDGGFDPQGRLSKDPSRILESKRVLPIGYWKGSGLSLALDLIAMCLSGGNSTLEIGKLGTERGLSQVFICFDLASFPDIERIRGEIEKVIMDLHSSEPDEAGGAVHYPGERTLAVREENLRLGIPVDEPYWRAVLEMPSA